MSQPPIPGEDNPNNDTKAEGENSIWNGGRNVYMGSGNYNERIEGDYVQGNKVSNYYSQTPSTHKTTEKSFCAVILTAIVKPEIPAVTESGFLAGWNYYF